MSIGHCIRELEGIVFAPIEDIEVTDIGNYRTCREPADSNEINEILRLVMDLSANELLRGNAVYGGLWDLLVHQYTLYSATPIALYRFLSTTSKRERDEIQDAKRFVEVCASQGTRAIFLTHEEIAKNKKGELPIFRVEDVIKAYGSD